MTSPYDETTDPDVRVARLERALVEHDGILIAELDGFLAALWLLPQEAPAGKWLPIVFGWGKDETYQGDSAADIELAKLIADHYNGVGFELRSGAYSPVYMAPDDEADDEVIWQPWAQGFGAAVGEFSEGFESLVAAETEAGEAFRMLVALIGVAMEDPDVAEDMGEENMAELAAAAPDLITECVYALYDAKLETSGALQPRTVTSVGRNDPCTCGSGKKFKKCCGAGE
ncbi:UPF0149 family protein [Asticcacaulis solisilvae]|uniref:UPF0149 family protein n=1 Tax=Asticcacaulis solisilvae TaxID=1217274 RepID=UPI003FD736C9